MRESSPSPMERITACRASNASMSRNCSVSVPSPSGLTSSHVAPPSVVRSTVPFVPLTQATCDDTGARPRKRSVVPVGVRVQLYAVALASPPGLGRPDGGRRRGGIRAGGAGDERDGGGGHEDGAVGCLHASST